MFTIHTCQGTRRARLTRNLQLAVRIQSLHHCTEYTNCNLLISLKYTHMNALDQTTVILNKIVKFQLLLNNEEFGCVFLKRQIYELVLSRENRKGTRNMLSLFNTCDCEIE